MIQGYWFDYTTALLAAISALYWARSAMVAFPFGYDMDTELKAAMKRASRFNAIGAGFAALAAALPAAKVFGTLVGVVHG